MMKKTILSLCGALSLVAFAEGPVPPPATPAQPPRPAMEAGNRPQRAMRPEMMPTRLVVTDATTPEQIAAFKAEVAKKIDEAIAANRAKPATEKRPLNLMFFANDGFSPRQGMNERPNMGPRGEGRGSRTDRPRRSASAPVELVPPPAPAAK